ncbi:Crp/Fnr family transcriptional regulator [Sphaerisporangium sp. TRM90804]|uniref:Crp/Fnr family transcriptional regulator n=1 Tax=Sphaerisporangium sp. TRM90804 TaxID=3031113 RepID=UPI00244AD945|nr:Crp/Fnr family transcriptional regulator [Sphaerisporangium sp. TRM90804]MDH2424975.1 Crp/Fnr family transcriptional regulator [Sphaerisporangium sp. TRM90804]
MPSSLSDLPMLHGVSAERLDALAARARHRRYPAGQVLCTAGDPVDHLVVLLGGRVKSARVGVDGREVVLRACGPPVAFDKAALLAGTPHRTTLTALTPVDVAYLPRHTILDLIAEEPSVAARLLRTLAETVCDLDERLTDVVLLDVTSRVAKWLVRNGADGPAVLHAGQSGLAAELGASRVAVNRALRSLERRGLIKITQGELHLLDHPALALLYDTPG